VPSQTNARLTLVTGATAATGGRDDWDAPGVAPGGPGAAPAPPVKWQAPAGAELNAYYRESVQRFTGADGPTVAPVRTLIIDSSVARAAGIDTDDVLTFTGPDGVVRTARATVIAVRELAGIPARLQTARLELEVK
jgi:hypothetical protein